MKLTRILGLIAVVGLLGCGAEEGASTPPPQETAGSAAPETGPTPEVEVSTNALALAVYTIQNAGTIGNVSTVAVAQALAMGYGKNTANYWKCTSDGPVSQPTGAICVHTNQPPQLNEVLALYGCTTTQVNVHRCSISLGFPTIGTVEWKQSNTIPWYASFDVRPNFPGYARFRSSPRQLVGCNEVTHPCPSPSQPGSWPIQPPR